MTLDKNLVPISVLPLDSFSSLWRSWQRETWIADSLSAQQYLDVWLEGYL